MRRGTISLLNSIGFDIASWSIMELSLTSPTKNLYGFPLKPCCLRRFSSLFGVNHAQSKALHAQATNARMQDAKIAWRIISISIFVVLTFLFKGSVEFWNWKSGVVVTFLFQGSKEVLTVGNGNVAFLVLEAQALFITKVMCQNDKQSLEIRHCIIIKQCKLEYKKHVFIDV